jgi:hypothetical protein
MVGLLLTLGCSGSTGPTGPQGAPGSPGATGPSGVMGSPGSISVSPPLSITDGGLSIVTASSTSDGAILASDFTRFSSKVDSVSAGAGLVQSGTSQAVQLAVDFGTASSQVVRGDDPRLSDGRPPLGGSANYIQNGSTPQVASFAITGAGAVGALSVGGNLSVSGSLSGDGSGLTSVTATRIAIATTNPSCNASTVGVVYFNTADHAIRVCNGSAFVVIGALGTYCGTTAASTTGAILNAGRGGYEAATGFCETTCNSPNAHMCSTEEWTRSRQLGVWPASFPSGFPWISAGLAFATASGGQVNDCAGWTTSSSSISGPVGSTSAPLTQTCDISSPIACCL